MNSKRFGVGTTFPTRGRRCRGTRRCMSCTIVLFGLIVRIGFPPEHAAQDRSTDEKCSDNSPSDMAQRLNESSTPRLRAPRDENEQGFDLVLQVCVFHPRATSIKQ